MTNGSSAGVDRHTSRRPPPLGERDGRSRHHGRRRGGRRDAAGWRSERGAATLWLLVLALMVLTLGGLSIDLWQVVSQRRALVGVADAAAYAGASGLDTDAFRERGAVRLDPARARAMADRSVRHQADVRSLVDWQVAADGGHITVAVDGELDTFLLRLVDPRLDHLDVTVTATAEPHAG